MNKAGKFHRHMKTNIQINPVNGTCPKKITANPVFGHALFKYVFLGIVGFFVGFKVNAQEKSVSAASSSGVNASIMKSMQWRLIGPYRGGRSVAVAGHPINKMEFYMGATGGGVWKTTDGGRSWKNVSDGYFKTGSVGAITVSQSNPDIVYVGMGEHTLRGNTSAGDGVYKSTDGGKTWINIGLKDTYHIGKIIVNPTNPDIVYVAALGHAFGPNEERGVFRSKDGGKSWKKVLYKSPDVGAIDLAIDPTSPDVWLQSGQEPF